MKDIIYVNISPSQVFDSRIYEDPDIIETIDDAQENEVNNIEPIDDSQYGDLDNTELIDKIDNGTEINMKCFDDRNEDILIEPLPSMKVASKILDIYPNLPEIPTGITDGVIAKIPVVLAQLLVPLNITSTVDLPELALEVKDIKKSLKLTECILLQPTNILYIKGFINKKIEYAEMTCVNSEGEFGKVNHYIIDFPFECSTEVIFFTEPLEPILNTKQVFQYGKPVLTENTSRGEKDSMPGELFRFNQISQEFFNEVPFCKLLSSKIVEYDEYIKPVDPKKTSIQIQEKMVIELKIEVLQNQPVVILPVNNRITKNGYIY